MATMDELMQQWNKDAKQTIITRGLQNEDLPRIPFSSATANYMTYGGMPRGKIVEFFGGEGGGKTTSALDIVANAQGVFEDERVEGLIEARERLESAIATKKSAKTIKVLEEEVASFDRPKQIVFADLERTLDAEWARTIGVDVDSQDFIIFKPNSESGEEILTKLLAMLSTGEVGLMVLDSIPMLVPSKLLSGDLSDKVYAGISAALATFCSLAIPILADTGALLININQIREDLQSQYNLYKTPGGKAAKHAYCVRLHFSKGSPIDALGDEIKQSESNPQGNIVKIKVEKTKAFIPDRKLGSYTLSYTDGVYVEADLIEMAVIYGFVAKAGSWYQVIDPETGELMQDPDGKEIKSQGKANFIRLLREDEEIYDMLMEAVHTELTAV